MNLVPNETLTHILQYLSFEEMGEWAKVCVRFRSVVMGEVAILGTRETGEGRKSVNSQIIRAKTLAGLPGVQEVHLRISLGSLLPLPYLDRRFSSPLVLQVPRVSLECLRFVYIRFMRDSALVTHIKDLEGHRVGWNNGTLSLVFSRTDALIVTEGASFLSFFAPFVRRLKLHAMALPNSFYKYLNYAALEEITLDSWEPFPFFEECYQRNPSILPRCINLRVIRYKKFLSDRISTRLEKNFRYLPPNIARNITHAHGLMVDHGSAKYTLHLLPGLRELNIYTSSVPKRYSIHFGVKYIHKFFESPVLISDDTSDSALHELRAEYPGVLFHEYRRM